MAQSTSFDFTSLVEQAKQFWGKLTGKISDPSQSSERKKRQIGIPKQTYIGALVLLGLIVLGIGWFGWKARMKYTELAGNISTLKELKNYDLAGLWNDDIFADEKDGIPQTIAGMYDFYTEAEVDKQRVEGELEFKKSVYTQFLRNLLLPSLNIWKEPHSQNLDLSILGKKYLDVNPYQDLSLLSQWSAIIKESGKDIGDNEIVNMKIGDIQEEDNGFFHIPISISFKSDSKRAFLLLVDKLSLTSNMGNLGLLNDFTYYLFEAIRARKADSIKQLAQEYQMPLEDLSKEKLLTNTVIARYLHTHLHTSDTQVNLLVDEKVIDQAVRHSVVCNQSDTTEVCYFRFRDKYRTLPGLAYAIGLEQLVNKPLALKKFFLSIPPLIAIDSFTFDKAKAQGLSLSDNNAYVGNVNFKIYGRGITPEESVEISNGLVELCFGSGSQNTLDVPGVLVPVESALQQMGMNGQANVDRMTNLLELKDTLSEEIKTFDALSPYNKIIKKFEFYRMLKHLGLCSK